MTFSKNNFTVFLLGAIFGFVGLFALFVSMVVPFAVTAAITGNASAEAKADISSSENATESATESVMEATRDGGQFDFSLPPSFFGGEIFYGEESHQVGEVYLPDVVEGAQVVLYVNSGANFEGSAVKGVPNWVLELVSGGWVVLNVNVRSSNGIPVVVDAVKDVELASFWVRDNASTYGFLGSDIILVAGGIGGVVAGLSMRAESASEYSGLIVFDSLMEPMSAFYFPEKLYPFTDALGCAGFCSPAELGLFSVSSSLTRVLPPTFFMFKQGDEAEKFLAEQFVESVQAGDFTGADIWLSSFNPETSSPSNTTELQLFLTEQKIIASKKR